MNVFENKNRSEFASENLSPRNMLFTSFSSFFLPQLRGIGGSGDEKVRDSLRSMTTPLYYRHLYIMDSLLDPRETRILIVSISIVWTLGRPSFAFLSQRSTVVLSVFWYYNTNMGENVE